ncbi:MAG: hypothetical protein PHW84_15590, partial [Methanosarcina sp.]|nr:hypothetical protein [Methanosarcina sp.]
ESNLINEVPETCFLNPTRDYDFCSFLHMKPISLRGYKLFFAAQVPLPEFRCPSSASGARGLFRFAQAD